jgi:hypothetical protein
MYLDLASCIVPTTSQLSHTFTPLKHQVIAPIQLSKPTVCTPEWGNPTLRLSFMSSHKAQQPASKNPRTTTIRVWGPSSSMQRQRCPAQSSPNRNSNTEPDGEEDTRKVYLYAHIHDHLLMHITATQMSPHPDLYQKDCMYADAYIPLYPLPLPSCL